mmetsp:Transcript_42590/g.123083  ORF Transcript_42590/g.123083 Transcript_42590/m.123083 type:complete len:98 (-) Transcript_42590:1239-1532(-)
MISPRSDELHIPFIAVTNSLSKCSNCRNPLESVARLSVGRMDLHLTPVRLQNTSTGTRSSACKSYLKGWSMNQVQAKKQTCPPYFLSRSTLVLVNFP